MATLPPPIAKLRLVPVLLGVKTMITAPEPDEFILVRITEALVVYVVAKALGRKAKFAAIKANRIRRICSFFDLFSKLDIYVIFSCFFGYLDFIIRLYNT